MRQSISTRYLGATNTRGSRVKAKSSSGLSLTLSWDDALDSDANHGKAAEALANKLTWTGRWIPGGAADGRGNVYVNDDGDGFTVGEPIAQDSEKLIERRAKPEAQVAQEHGMGLPPETITGAPAAERGVCPTCHAATKVGEQLYRDGSCWPQCLTATRPRLVVEPMYPDATS